MTLSALQTDLYQLTMLAGYYEHGLYEQPATFELFFRRHPFEGNYAVFAGLQPALDYLKTLQFGTKELLWLQQLGLFKSDFLNELSKFRFTGTVIAPAEGTVVFANEPLLTIEGTLAETQFVETALLNIINFQTLAATKAARICHAAGTAEVIEFGLRRAQGPDGALSLARAAAIGGVTSTSNLEAGYCFNLPVRGTHAHSWVMAFDDELSAFRAYAASFPDTCILLVDTYDTLESGLPNALLVASELRERGHELAGVRLDSGNIAKLSRKARQMFDQAGFPEVKIVASNELDEYEIERIRQAGGCIDIYGVGTRLATCAGPGGGALGGVYKLVELGGHPRFKTTSDPGKSTWPGKKEIWRATDQNNLFATDILTACAEEPTAPEKAAHSGTQSPHFEFNKLCQIVMQGGQQTVPAIKLEEMAAHCTTQLNRLQDRHKKTSEGAPYPVRLSPKLVELRNRHGKEHLIKP
ncbi:MAG: nicotinate phosphoribosyltransferase [Desulfuromonas sp.]|nr:MAG: nicotinate phosphoribosyltransferase [Desulfuromonas sp.]